MRIGMLGLLLAASCAGQALGAWKMNVAKSRFDNSPPKAVTARYEEQSEVEIWTFYQVRQDGEAETISQTLRFDGKEYPCGDLGLEDRPETVVSRKDAWTAEVVYKKSGRVTRRLLRTVSADGREMRLDIRITPEKGKVVERRLVFER